MTNVWVDENYRHLGIGRYMVEYLIENYQKDVGMICLNSSKVGMNMYFHLGFEKKDNYLIYKNKL
nr:GNAT family N-acetyltransferase [uncultured Faecalibacillus sp.]